MATKGGPEDQLVSCNLAIADYYEKVAGHVASMSPAVDFSTCVESLEFDELLRRAALDATGTADPATAIAVEEVHNNSAHVREYILSSQVKASIYLGIASEYTQSADYHKDRAVLFASLLRGDNRVSYLP